jgi:hypothetical protein
MCGHPGASGAGQDETAAQVASLFLTAPMLRRRYAQPGLRGWDASFGRYPLAVPYRTPACRGC